MILDFILAKKKRDQIKAKNQLNILIVDDDLDFLQSLKDIGSPSPDIVIYYCSNALEALKILQHYKIHGIFSDVNMLNMEQLDRVLYQKASEIPVYRFSGESPHHLNMRLNKPFSRNQYLDALSELAGLAKIVKAA